MVLTRRALSLALATAFLGMPLMLASCGGGTPRVAKKADEEIGTAERSLERAKLLQSKGEFEQAMSECGNAKSAISKGKEFASGQDLTRLKSLENEARQTLGDLEIQLLSRPKVAKTIAASTAVDPGEKIKKEAAEKEKKDAEAAAKAVKDAEAKLSAGSKGPTPGIKKKDDEDDTGGHKTAAAGPKADPKKDGEEDGDGKEPAPAKPKKVGPYPEITANSPALDIVKLFTKGKFVIAYIQLYNKGQNGKRIMAINVFFKDKDNALLVVPQTVITFPFLNFSTDGKDLTQQAATGVTLGSHAVDGEAALQLAAVGECDRSRDVKKVGVQVIYDDGTKDADVGPAAGADPAVAPVNIKGLK